MANTDGCDIFSWSTFARIVQECRVPLFLSPIPARVLLGLSSFPPSFPCYITPISPSAGAPSPCTPVVSISRTRYSLDRYASRLSLFCLSNIHSTAMWVRIGRLLCSCSRSRGCNAATIRYLATAVTLIAIILLRLSYLCRDISGVLNVPCSNLKHRSESQYSFLSPSF